MKKTLALTVAAMCVAAAAYAAPSTSWQKGEGQINVGMWDVGVKINADDEMSQYNSDASWNFMGGAAYGLTNKWGLEYQYHNLRADGHHDQPDSEGNENEVNLGYSLGKRVAAYAGWNRIYNKLEDNGHKTNDVAQFGLIYRAPLTKSLDWYARGALGSKETSIWEAGLALKLVKNLELDGGYRQISTEASDDQNIKYRGWFMGLTYHFGRHAKKTAPVYVAPVVQEPVAPVQQHVYNDYYLDSIHFGYDEDQPLANQADKLANFVKVAKANPNDTFKLVGNTDSDGSDNYNNDLSKRRVENVAKYGTDNGVPAAQMKQEFRGEKDPVATNSTAAGKADNRRVDIWWHK